MIIREIETMEAADQNIWVPIGILEIMYDDYEGIIDSYFHSDPSIRDVDRLWSCLNTINWTHKDKGSNFLKPDPLLGWVWT